MQLKTIIEKMYDKKNQLNEHAYVLNGVDFRTR